MDKAKSPAEDRMSHPEGERFDDFWCRLLIPPSTASCFERDVLREVKNELWEVWKRRADECDRRVGDYAPNEHQVNKGKAR